MKQNTGQAKQFDLQQVIQQLLASGLSYLQVWSKIQACKSLFKKGTPEFYSCLGINPPPSHHNTPSSHSKPHSHHAPPTHSKPHSPPVQQAGMSLGGGGSNKMKILLIGGVLLLALFIFKDSRRRYNEELMREEGRR